MKGENHTKYNEQKTPKKQWDKNRDFSMRKRGKNTILPKKEISEHNDQVRNGQK